MGRPFFFIITSVVFVIFFLDFGYTCPGGYERHGSSCYHINTHGNTWSTARGRCQHDGGYIVEVGSSHENTLIRNIVIAHHVNQTWLGASDKYTEGRWVWITSQQLFTYKAWKNRHPSNASPDDDCLALSLTESYATWHDVNCDTKLPYICEMSLSI